MTPTPSRTVIINAVDPSATEALGNRLGAMLFPGAVLALIGPLGAGKTHFTRALAHGAGVRQPNAVNSPTFVLVQEYDGPLPIYHFDTYRLPDSQAFADLGAGEYLAGDGVCIIEWADKVSDQLPTEHLRITFTITGEQSRSIELTAFGVKYVTMVDILHT